MDDELRSKIEEVVEEKVEESLEEDADTKFSKLVDKKIERKLREGKIEATREISSDNEMNRRSFLKILGLSSAGIGLASSGAAANLLQGTKINGNTVFHTGNDGSGSGLDADQVDGFDIQKNGNDTNGVINFNTNQKTITVDGTFVVGSAVPDSVVSQYDATEEDLIGDITTISDLVGSFNLSGNASVISNGINGLQTFRFDGTESMSHTDTVATSDPFAVIMVIQQQESSTSNFILDGGSQDELRVQDGGGGTYDLARNNFIGSGGTPDTNPHILLVEGFGGSDARVELDGTELVNGTGATTDLTGLIFPASPSRGELQADIGQVEVTQGHSDSDLQSIKERLQNKWGTPSLS